MRSNRKKTSKKKSTRLRNGSAFSSLKQLKAQFPILRRGNHLTPHVKQRLNQVFGKLLKHSGIGEPTVSVSGKLDYLISLNDGSSICLEFIFSVGQVEQDFVRIQEARADFKILIYADEFLDTKVYRRVQQKNLAQQYPFLLLSTVLLAKNSPALMEFLKNGISRAREMRLRDASMGRSAPGEVVFESRWDKSGGKSEKLNVTPLQIEGHPIDQRLTNAKLVAKAEAEILRATQLLSEEEWVIRKDAYDIFEGYSGSVKPEAALAALRGRWKSLDEAKDTRDRTRIIKVLGVLEQWKSLSCILRHLYTGIPLAESSEKSEVDNFVKNAIGTSPYRSLRVLHKFIGKLLTEKKGDAVINDLLESVNVRRATDERDWDPPEKKWVRSIEQLFSKNDDVRFSHLRPLREYLNGPRSELSVNTVIRPSNPEDSKGRYREALRVGLASETGQGLSSDKRAEIQRALDGLVALDLQGFELAGKSRFGSHSTDFNMAELKNQYDARRMGVIDWETVPKTIERLVELRLAVPLSDSVAVLKSTDPRYCLTHLGETMWRLIFPHIKEG